MIGKHCTLVVLAFMSAGHPAASRGSVIRIPEQTVYELSAPTFTGHQQPWQHRGRHHHKHAV